MNHITNIISRVFGLFADTKFPTSFQNLINIGYVKIMNLDMSDFKDPKNYKSLNELFTRKLEKKRIFDTAKNIYISPCDAIVSYSGKISKSKLFQIKGKSYSLDLLLGSNAIYKDLVSNGNYMNFYLSPKDYHRYHAPCDLTVEKLIHIPGALYPVNFTYLNKKPSLFIENERVILECKDSYNKIIYLVFVGALNVGKMIFHFEPSLNSNIKINKTTLFTYKNQKLKKGEEIGYFKMGSTIVMITQEKHLSLKRLNNKHILFGKTIASVK
jgi:phosphatidylserine decarboxylase